ncbi:MAG TPA: tetratricopeptide repeat protein, partial [Pyrinomonadaceae bacterium]|nr:tetratricopeptide repeat protein [Pyrinomonadaceae bacterium]
KALGIFRKVADLDPQNTEARVKLAEGYVREGMEAEAADAFGEAGAQFMVRGEPERAIEVFTLSLGLRPHDYNTLSGMLSAHTALGTPDEAAEVLESALAARPDDIELLAMLANAYLEAEDAPAAERVVTALMVREPSNYTRFVDVALLFLKSGKTDDAVRILSSITEQMLSGREEERLMELLNEVLARDPEHVEALRLLVRVYAWQRDDDKQRQTLERLVEAAEGAGLEEVERSALLQLAQFSPDQRYLERLQSLGYAPGQKLEEEVAEPGSVTQEVPSFESFAFSQDEATASAMGLPATEGVAEFEFNSVAEPAPDSTPDPAASFADLNDDWNPPASSQEGSAFSSGGFQEFSFGEVASTQSRAEAPTETIDPRREAMLKQELDSVDFYLAQGYMDIAADTLDMLENQFGAHDEIKARRAKLSQPTPPPAASTPPVETVEFESFARYDVAEETAPAEAENVHVEEIFAEPEKPAPPTQPEAPMPQPPAAQTSASVTGPGIDPGLAAIFDEFRTAAEEEEPASADGDYETHYNLGIAYKEMELLDEAVEEFQVAASMTSPQDGTPRYLQCCNMLGHCFMDKGMPRLAVMWFKKGLGSPGHTEDEYQALRYDLGTAYEQMGDLNNAIEVFTEVYGINISYRGVAEKLRELQEQKSVTGDR